MVCVCVSYARETCIKNRRGSNTTDNALDGGDEAGVGGEGVDVLLLAHVPHLHHVLRPARRHLVPVVVVRRRRLWIIKGGGRMSIRTFALASPPLSMLPSAIGSHTHGTDETREDGGGRKKTYPLGCQAAQRIFCVWPCCVVLCCGGVGVLGIGTDDRATWNKLSVSQSVQPSNRRHDAP